MTDDTRKRIVILGGGFAGVSTARELCAKARRRPDIEVHLVSDENYFVFQPLLPEVVGCGIEPGHILNPIRQLCPGVHFHGATVESIDTVARRLVLLGADERFRMTLDYDHLVIALGLTIDLSRTPGMTEHSLPIKTLGDAFHLRNHVISRLEQADIEPDESQRRKLLTFLAVGGGFSGVETIAEINDMIKAVLRFYPRARETGARVILVHSRERILNELNPRLAAFAEKKLKQRGVELLLNCRVGEATSTGLVLADGTTIEAGTIVCTVGNAPHPLIASTKLPQEKGRLLVDDRLRVRENDNIWSLGDAALVPDARRGGFCPPTAQYAMRQGVRCARNIVSVIDGKPPLPFKFAGLGQLAVVGHRSGVAEIMGLRISGPLAWFLWRSVYWMKLPGLRCKIRVGLDWALDALFPRDITKLAVDRTQLLRRAHYRAGDVIIKEGEIGDRFYIIESGEVEILHGAAGPEPKRIAVRKEGDSFGEIALLKDSPRTATVRCLTPVNVVTFTRRDFTTLVSSYGLLKEKITRDAADRAAPGDIKHR
jgi:NADH dehydrogenase